MAVPDPSLMQELLSEPASLRSLAEFHPMAPLDEVFTTAGYERYSAGWADWRAACDPDEGVVIDGEFVELAGILEGPDGASTED